MTEVKKTVPTYSGMKQHNDRSGFGLWLPNDWHQFDLKDEHEGVLFSPYPDDFNTGLLAEKHRLEVNVTASDLPILRDAFMDGIRALDGVEIETGSEAEFINEKGLSFFEVRFTFLEGEICRKRWIRNIYWNKNNYVLIAQGKTPEDFDYWLPMFYNIMMTVSI